MMLLKSLNEKKYHERIQLLFVSSRGSASRRRILEDMQHSPRNCNQIANALGLNWWGVQKHLQFLMVENMVEVVRFGRRKLFRLTPDGECAFKTLFDNDLM